MSWNKIIGQNRVVDILRNTITSGRVAHAYLFAGPEGIGKEALAIEFARVLNCNAGGPDACGVCDGCRQFSSLQHPNLHLVFALPAGKGEKKGDDPITVLTDEQVSLVKEEIRKKAADQYYRIQVAKSNTIKINSIRTVKREASMTQAERGKKVLVILRAEEMNAEAANSLLKTLEEPLSNTVLVLTTTDRDALPPTIISRCQVIVCDILTEEEIRRALVERDGVEETEAALASSMANGSYSTARTLVSSDIKKQKDEVVNFVRTLLGPSRVALYEEVERLVSEYERPQVEQWLRLLGAWIRDGIVLRERGIPPVGSDEETLRRFVGRFPNAQLPEALARVDESIAHLDKNIYLSLLLSSLAIDLRELLIGQG